MKIKERSKFSIWLKLTESQDKPTDARHRVENKIQWSHTVKARDHENFAELLVEDMRLSMGHGKVLLLVLPSS